MNHKKPPVQRMASIRMDQELADRLDRLSEQSGISKTRLIADGLSIRLDRLEASLEQKT